MVLPWTLSDHPAKYRKQETVAATSTALAIDTGFPLSKDSRCASWSAFFSIKSARRCSRRPRSDAGILRHAPRSNAARAALTAFSTSPASASEIWQISSPVDGLMVANVLPDSLGTQRLLIKSFVAETAAWLSLAGDITEAIGVLLGVYEI